MGNSSSRSARYSSSHSLSPRGRPILTKRVSKKYMVINDNYNTLEQVQDALSQAGLESSNLIVGIDFTKSNEWTGKHSFNGRCLHAIGEIANPYEQALSIIGRTLSKFDDDNLIPCFGFGDATTHDQHVFSFHADHRPCTGFEEALSRYQSIVPHLRLAGPTSFAPIIETAVKIVEESGCQYHVLLIIADGQVTRSVNVERGNLSPQEQKTIDAIVAASAYPLSIILVGVGDGPWDMMREFDNNIPDRQFDNFQFVNFSEIMSKPMPSSSKEAMFALSALMEVPSQYNATMELNLLGSQRHQFRNVNSPLMPPQAVLQADEAASRYVHARSPQFDSQSYYSAGSRSPSASVRSQAEEGQMCPVCMSSRKDMAFGCGHQTCRDCGDGLQNCPICRQRIKNRIRLY